MNDRDITDDRRGGCGLFLAVLLLATAGALGGTLGLWLPTWRGCMSEVGSDDYLICSVLAGQWCVLVTVLLWAGRLLGRSRRDRRYRWLILPLAAVLLTLLYQVGMGSPDWQSESSCHGVPPVFPLIG
ncbi:hypothetical protein [Kitasatospora sp. NPDC088346]|uniref:hypothetical protein n=1 Tax=Kitasatospora sp. NPDC088346 TaxID=3364073 RepID=UPI0038146895